MAGRSSTRGRKDALDEARELISLLSALSQTGDTITVNTISSRLGVSESEAKKFIEMLSMAGGIDQGFLSLYFVDEDETEIAVSFDEGNTGRPLRLTRQETVALMSALNYIGVGPDDPIRRQLESGFLTDDNRSLDVIRTLYPAYSPDTNEAFSTCNDSLVEGTNLSFLYQGHADNEPKRRIVRPTGMRSENGTWYLDAYDLLRREDRTFRIDRMRKVEERVRGVRTPASPSEHPAREVRLRFNDESLLDLFEWPGLKVITRTEYGTTASIMYYAGSNWLPRRIAAAGAGISCDDEEIRHLARQYAQEQLSMADDLR